MRDVLTGPAVRSAWATRRDLLLETLALRHQLSVLARSNRCFRPSDRLLWLLLRWLWPRWREALVLVQPATVDRWHREGLRRCWRRRSRRPGRRCIDSQCRDLIRRLAAENCLWGAPRIHGELLRLGIAISERTVSQYLRGRPTTRSQTWCTFLANHLGDRTFISPVMFSDGRGDDVVVDASDSSARPSPWAIGGSFTHLDSLGECRLASFARTHVSWRASRPRSSSGPYRRAKEHRPGPAAASTVATGLTASGQGFFLPCLQCLCDRRQSETNRPPRARHTQY